MKVATRDKFNERWEPEPMSGCWLWTGAVSQNAGYGLFWNGEKLVGAHRHSYEMHSGKTIPGGLLVIHSCDVRSCVNPDHLRVGTYHDNHKDMRDRGRWNPQVPPLMQGEDHGMSKLTVGEILEIRSLYGIETQRFTAKRYGVTASNISKIQRLEAWKHV